MGPIMPEKGAEGTEGQQPDIPVLKEEKKERKGAGVPLPGAGGSGSGALAGARGAGLAAHAGGRGVFGFVGRIMAGLEGLKSAPIIGSLMRNAIVRGLALGVLLVGGTMLCVKIPKVLARWNRGQRPARFAFPDKYAKASADSVKWGMRHEGTSLPYTKYNMMVKPQDKAALAGGVEGEEGEGDEIEQAEDETPDADAMAEDMMGNLGDHLAGAMDGKGKLKKMSLGDPGQSAASLGGSGRISAASGFLRQFDKSAFKQKGKSSPMKKGKRRMRTAMGGLSAKKVSANRAMGQLKFANKSGKYAKGAGGQAQAADYASAAFDQGALNEGGGSPGGGGLGEGPDTPTGGNTGLGASGMGGGGGSGGGLGEIPPVGPGTNVTPYQGNLDAAGNLQNQGANLLDQGDDMVDQGTTLIYIGAAIFAIGVVLACIPYTATVGKYMMVIGALIAGVGMYMVNQGEGMRSDGEDMIDQSREQGQQVEDQYGQSEQSDLVDDRADSAEGGEDELQGHTPDQVDIPENEVQEDVQEEQDSTFDLH